MVWQEGCAGRVRVHSDFAAAAVQCHVLEKRSIFGTEGDVVKTLQRAELRSQKNY